jgi:hypothetical protein
MDIHLEEAMLPKVLMAEVMIEIKTEVMVEKSTLADVIEVAPILVILVEKEEAMIVLVEEESLRAKVVVEVTVAKVVEEVLEVLREVVEEEDQSVLTWESCLK